MPVHRFWVGPPRPQHRWITAVVRGLHGYVQDWSPEMLPSELGLDPGDDPRHLSNVARYWLLREYGGLYLDMDVIPFRDLTKISLDPWTAALGQHREGTVMWFPEPGHPMLSALLEAVKVGDGGRTAPLRSGAEVLHRVGLDYPNVGLEQRVLPFDARGQRVGHPDGEVLALGQWTTSSQTLTAGSSSRSADTPRRGRVVPSLVWSN